MRDMLNRVLDGENLRAEEAHALMLELAAGAVPPAQSGALLAGLRAKGETPDEIRGFAQAMRELATQPEIEGARPLVDTCGTGGDGSHSLNLSTGAALLAAACGAGVVKHGNRSVSSRSGSADVLEQLGIQVGRGPEQDRSDFQRAGFCFLFAPTYHPAMKAIMPVRRAMGVRTVFNMLGPLSNPACPPHQVVGAWSLDVARKMAAALSGLGLVRAFVVHGAGGWDEATPAGPFVRIDVRGSRVVEEVIDPVEHGVPRCTEDDLRGGDAETNALRLREALAGRDTVPHRDALALGAGLALEACGLAGSLAEGVERAREVMACGQGSAVLRALVEPS